MILKLIKLLYQTCDIRCLLKEVTQWLQQEVKLLKEEIAKQINILLLKAVLWICTMFLILMMLFFLLVALASYLNALLGSSCIGLLIVACICLLLSLVLMRIARVATKRSNRKKQ